MNYFHHINLVNLSEHERSKLLYLLDALDTTPNSNKSLINICFENARVIKSDLNFIVSDSYMKILDYFYSLNEEVNILSDSKKLRNQLR